MLPFRKCVDVSSFSFQTLLTTYVVTSLLFSSNVYASLSVNLYKAGYNYYTKLDIKNNTGFKTYNTIIDTGNPSSINPSSLYIIQHFNHSYNYSATASGSPCYGLLEDTYYAINFLGMVPYNQPSSNYRCPNNKGLVSFTGTNTDTNINNITYRIYSKFQTPTNNLYNWSQVNGDMGLAYCNSGTGSAGNSCQMSYFQSVLNNTKTYLNQIVLFGNKTYFPNYYNVSKPLVFALDFKHLTSDNSTMQLGYLQNQYSSSISWTPPLYSSPQYHQFSIKELSLCGINILGNWSKTWPVLIDTGSTCLSLPQEMYDSVAGWIRTNLNTKDTTTTTRLPGFSFRLSDGSSKSQLLYIPLGNLILNNNTIITSINGGPKVNLNGGFKQLCIIRGKPITTGRSDGTLNIPAIVFGTLTLQSLYFAADFTTGHIGLASKVSNTAINDMTSPEANNVCQNPTVCKGDQKYVSTYNRCISPSCSHYVFMTVDTSTQTCSFNNTALGFGLFFILTTILLELISFFILQYTTYEFLTKMSDNPIDDEDDNEQKRLKLKDAKKIDFITIFCGKWCAFIFDRWLRS